ncbi:MAG: hypothetical protein AAGD05_05025 [Bacteroidota bacterium]
MLFLMSTTDPLSFAAPSSSETNFRASVENYLPQAFRQFIEQNFYAKVGEQAQLKNLKKDPDFHKNPIKHIGLYTDRGVVHVRDVALQTLEVVEKVNGVLIPQRDAEELEFLKAYSLQLAYLHDIGMSDFSNFGRFMHPEFAAQFVFHPDFDALFEQLWLKNAGNIPWTLLHIFQGDCDQLEQKRIYRELLAFSVAHSKSKMPIEIVNDLDQLRARMLQVLSQPLNLLFFEQKIRRLQLKISKSKIPAKIEVLQKKIVALEKQLAHQRKKTPPTNQAFTKHYDNYSKQAFQWVKAKNKKVKRLMLNIQDAIRCLRTADALRQRGTVLRTSAGYEIFIDRKTANAIYALRNEKNDALYLLEGKKTINAGEANLAASELDRNGNLRVSFHVGAFKKRSVLKKAVHNAAVIINDIQADTIQSFRRAPTNTKPIFPSEQTPFERIKILIESIDDNPDFSKLVCTALAQLNPAIADRIETAISLQGADLAEVQRYLSGQMLDAAFKATFQNKIRRHLKAQGYHFSKEEALPGAADLRIIHLRNGDQLIRGGSVSGFVYFPLSAGLRVYPLGGYQSKPALAWLPIGNTGVIRGSVRNASVIAERAVRLLCIPKEIYLNDWYAPFSPRDLIANWKKNS